MSENETIPDIAAEKREIAAKIRAELSQVSARREDQLLEAESLEREADRIEAAAKREREPVTDSHGFGNAVAREITLDEAIAHAEDVADRCDTACGRQHRQLADWLKELRNMKSQPIGNSAAMREALKHCIEELQPYCDGGERKDDVLEEAKSALSEPARNCDFYDNKTDAETGFVEETGEDDRAQHYWQMFANWLFAIAAERKGEGDGNG